VDLQERRYRPHLTVARHRTPVDLRDVLTDAPAYRGPPWTVAEVVLVESRLGPQVQHLPRARFRLRSR
ncbi:MAG: RNA 2',3'-cyclic phosphodiesterase, partial [Actinomycetota bacterium]|nr:RNA 2',3'-cyclic phosphodiesterase [Actinomycetota bacterium]